MEKVYLATYDEEDDLYSGFNEFHPTLNTSTLVQDPVKDGKNQSSNLQVYLSKSKTYPILIVMATVFISPLLQTPFRNLQTNARGLVNIIFFYSPKFLF